MAWARSFRKAPGARRLASWGSTGVLLALGLASGCVRAPAGPQAGGPPAQVLPGRPSLPVLGAAPAFSYLTQEGRRLSSADLLGHVWIADFIFTACTNVCPMLTARMAMLQRRIADPHVRFISFSVDPAHDTPEVLRQYAARWRQDEPRWLLLATTRQTVAAVVEGLLATVAPGMTPNEPLAHSNDFTLVDASGLIRGVYSSEDEAQLVRLREDLGELTRGSGPAPAAASAPDGSRLYAELGCGGCHADARLAPPLEGLYGQTVALDDDRSVVADSAYLRESVLEPNAKVVDGYPTTMPSYLGQLSPAQLGALVGYLRSLAGAAPAAPPRHRAIDPVCRMEVSAGPDTLHASHAGETVYFCSEICRTRFLENPQLYPAPGKK
jgi:protein SCO1